MSFWYRDEIKVVVMDKIIKEKVKGLRVVIWWVLIINSWIIEVKFVNEF